MTDSPGAHPPGDSPRKGDVNLRLFVPLMAHTVAVNTVVALARVTTSYRAIELDLSVVWLGVIAAGFSLIPVFMAVWVGRFIDRGHDAVSAWIGAALMLGACAGFWLWPTSAMNLLAFSVLLGFGHMFCMASHQMMTVRSAGPRSREAVFGYHMIFISLGQGLGPSLLGWLGGSAAIPPTDLLFTITFAGSIVALALAFGLRPAPKEPAHDDATAARVTVGELLRMRGLVTVLMASVVTVTAFELLVIYLPLLGTERGIDTRDVGLLLAVRSGVSITSRFFYSRLIELVGRKQLMLTCMFAGAAGFLLMGLPVSLPFMYVAIVIMGFGLGIGATLTFSEVVLLAPLRARGVALSLRLTGNRIGQLLVPVLASVLAKATGMGGVLIIIAGALAASGVSLRISLGKR
jgi:MFS family permease